MSDAEFLVFVGGLLDGSCRQVRRNERWYHHRKIDFTGLEGREVVRDTVYERASFLERIEGDEPEIHEVQFFRLVGMSNSDALEMLLEFYAKR